jgi:hypothetical protein
VKTLAEAVQEIDEAYAKRYAPSNADAEIAVLRAECEALRDKNLELQLLLDGIAGMRKGGST